MPWFGTRSVFGTLVDGPGTPEGGADEPSECGTAADMDSSDGRRGERAPDASLDGSKDADGPSGPDIIWSSPSSPVAPCE